MKRKQKCLGNKGFSLVELIVVIAIMAVLIGVLAPTLIKNVEKSKESTDIQNLDTIRGAVTTAMSDEAIAKEVTGTVHISLGSAKDATLDTGDFTGDTYKNLKAELKEIITTSIKTKSAQGRSGNLCIDVINGKVIVSIKPASGVSGNTYVSCNRIKTESGANQDLKSE